MYPSFTISAQAITNALSFSNWFNIPAFFWTGNGMNYPTSAPPKRAQCKYEIAKIESEKSAVQFRQQIIVAVGEVSDTLVRIEKLREQKISANNRVSILNQTVNNLRVLFKNGETNYLEIIIAQSSALESQSHLSTLKKDSGMQW